MLQNVMTALRDGFRERVGFDKAVECGGVGRAPAQSKYNASDLIAAILYYAVILITLRGSGRSYAPRYGDTSPTQY